MICNWYQCCTKTFERKILTYNSEKNNPNVLSFNESMGWTRNTFAKVGGFQFTVQISCLQYA